MSLEIEAAADVVNTTLVVAEIEGHGTSEHARCANCETPLQGRYCHACGQVAHVHRSVLHMVEELLHGMLHFDTKAGRTIPMLVAKPGTLTRNYIDGKRTRYVSPLGLFMFLVFLMFFVFSYLGTHYSPDTKNVETAKLGLVADLAKSKIELENAQKTHAQLKASKADDEKIADAQEAIDEAKAKSASIEEDLKDLEKPGKVNSAPALDAKPKFKGISTDGKSEFDKAVRNAIKNPELLVYKLQNTASKYAFMLVPISLPFLWLMFCTRRDVSMYDHAVFSLYSLSFMSVLFIMVGILWALDLQATAGVFAIFVPPIHMFAQLRGTYRLGIFSALWRTWMLLGVAGTVFVLFLGFVTYMTVR